MTSLKIMTRVTRACVCARESRNECTGCISLGVCIYDEKVVSLHIKLKKDIVMAKKTLVWGEDVDYSNLDNVLKEGYRIKFKSKEEMRKVMKE